MADNPFTRTATITITELVPERGELPWCSAWQNNGDNCRNKGRFMQGEVPVCGVHVGKPGTIWIPSSRRTA